MESSPSAELLSKKARRLANKLRKKTAEANLLGKPEELPTLQMASESGAKDWKGGVGGTLERMQRELTAASKEASKRRDKSDTVRLHVTMDKLRGRRLGPSDIQDLLLFSVLGSSAVQKPKWINLKPWRLVSESVLVVVEVEGAGELVRRGVGRSLQALLQDKLPFTRTYFTDRLHFAAPPDAKDFYRQIFQVAISPAQVLREKLRAEAKESAERKAEAKDEEGGQAETDEPRIATLPDLLLSSRDMLDFGYPLPLGGAELNVSSASSSFAEEDGEVDGAAEEEDSEDFVFTATAYKRVTEDSPVFALDCEMCLVGRSAQHRLTRVSVVDAEGRVVLDSLVRPRGHISNYLTRYSGITPDMMHSCTTRLEDVQRALQRLLPPDGVLVGHSLNFDLLALRLWHPWCVDVSLLFNLSGNRQAKSSLATLARAFLGQGIQGSSNGHCSIEDAVATLRLMELKLAQPLEFGNVELGWVHRPPPRPRSATPPADTVTGLLVSEVSTTKMVNGRQRAYFGIGACAELLKRQWEPSPAPVASAKPRADSPPAKKVRRNHGKRKPARRSPSAEPPSEQCGGCGAGMAYPGCVTTACLCRRTPHLSCPACNTPQASTDQDTASQPPSTSEKEEMLAWEDAMGLRRLSDWSGRDDPLRKFLDEQRKGLLLAGSSQAFRSAAREAGGFPEGAGLTRRGGKTAHLQRFCPPSADDAALFRQHMLEHEVAVLSLSLRLPGSEASSAALDLMCLSVDEALANVVQTAPPKALVAIAFLPLPHGGAEAGGEGEASEEPLEPLLCLKVK